MNLTRKRKECESMSVYFHVHIASDHTGVTVGLPVCLYLGYQEGSCVLMCMRETEREPESLTIQKCDHMDQIPLHVLGGIQKYGRNLS